MRSALEVRYSLTFEREISDQSCTWLFDSDEEAEKEIAALIADLRNAGAAQWDWSSCEAFASVRRDHAKLTDDAALFIFDHSRGETIVTIILRCATLEDIYEFVSLAHYITREGKRVDKAR